MDEAAARRIAKSSATLVPPSLLFRDSISFSLVVFDIHRAGIKWRAQDGFVA